jgi:hypothetical protein
MGIVARYAFYPGIVSFRIIEPFDVRPVARGIWQMLMTPETKPPALVYRQLGRIIGMCDGGTMAILARDYGVRRFHNAFILVGMAILAIFRSLILDLESLPILDVAFPVPGIHVTSLMDTEILRHIHHPRNQNERNYAEDDPKRSKDVIFHLHLIWTVFKL